VISDPEEPMDKRVEYARTLSVAGEHYYYTYSMKDRNGGWKAGIKSEEPNGGYITRIAHLALDNLEHEDLCTALLDSIQSFARSISQRREEHTTADMLAAIPILDKIYKSTKSQMAKLRIDFTLAYMDKSALKRINPDCGPVITSINQLQLRLKDQGTQCLFVSYTASDFADEPIKLTPYLVLQNTASGGEYHLSFNEHMWKHRDNVPPIPGGNRVGSRDDFHSFDGKSSVGLGRTIVLPKDLPAGKYRVYIEYRDGDKVVSKGHYRKIDI
jgi:hypothetical protein